MHDLGDTWNGWFDHNEIQPYFGVRSIFLVARQKNVQRLGRVSLWLLLVFVCNIKRSAGGDRPSQTYGNKYNAKPVLHGARAKPSDSQRLVCYLADWRWDYAWSHPSVRAVGATSLAARPLQAAPICTNRRAWKWLTKRAKALRVDLCGTASVQTLFSDRSGGVVCVCRTHANTLRWSLVQCGIYSYYNI